jgi:predicted  nucleic acid-binding Zn-ribbon protein
MADKKEKSLKEKVDDGEVREDEIREKIDALKEEAHDLEQLVSRARAAKDAGK